VLLLVVVVELLDEVDEPVATLDTENVIAVSVGLTTDRVGLETVLAPEAMEESMDDDCPYTATMKAVTSRTKHGLSRALKVFITMVWFCGVDRRAKVRVAQPNRLLHHSNLALLRLCGVQAR
jgi:hypothetical protein